MRRPPRQVNQGRITSLVWLCSR